MAKEAGAKTASIAFGELSEIDLDSLDHLGDEELSGHFRALAERASEGQLRELLGMGYGDIGGREALAEAYAARKLAVARRLRALRDGG